MEAPAFTLHGNGSSVSVAGSEIGGEQLLELTEFITKKAWIDDKIEFLASLPEIDAILPHPPEHSPTTQDVLKTWWEEHDRIELEVDTYDMGDLARLKVFAKSASKRNLSPRDTDLIEIALTTLFAVDKLLHLLRARRKSLTLLGYRLRWEAATTTAWAQHRQILSSLPKFLARTRYRPPSQTLAASPIRSHSLSLSQSSSTLHDRSLRSSDLSLILSNLATTLHAAKRSLQPTSIHLDKLIDTSPMPLPEAFLDVQEELEEAVGALEGMEEFAADLVTQWKGADDITSSGEDVRKGADRVSREIKEAGLEAPRRDIAEGFERRLAELGSSLAETEGKRGRRDIIPSPSHPHPALVDQPAVNSRLYSALDSALATARASWRSAETEVSRYRFAAEALERCKAVQGLLDSTLAALQSFSGETRNLAGRPQLDDLSFLEEARQEEHHFEGAFDLLLSDVRPVTDGLDALLKKAQGVVVDLRKAGLDPTLRQAVSDEMDRCRTSREEVERTVADRKREREVLAASRTARHVLVDAEEAMKRAEETIEQEMNRARWKHNEEASNDPFNSQALLDSMTQLVATVTPPLAHASSLLLPMYPPFHNHLASRYEALRLSLSSLSRSHQLLDTLRAQQKATTLLLADTARLDSETDALLSMVESDLRSISAKELSKFQVEVSSSTLQGLKERMETLTSSAWERIPFVSAPSTSSGPLDLKKQDEDVREVVNRALVATAGKLDETGRKIDLLNHLRRALEWDMEMQCAQEKSGRVGWMLERLKEDLENRSDDSADVTDALGSAAESIDASLFLAVSAREALSITLANLSEAPLAIDPLFSAHITRHDLLSTISAQHDAFRSSLANLLSSIDEVGAARKAREAAEAALLSRGRETEDATRQLLKELEDLLAELDGLAGRPDVSSCSCLSAAEGEDAFLRSRNTGVERLQQLRSKAPDTMARAVEASDAVQSLDAELATALMKAHTSLDDALVRSSGQLEKEEKEQARLDAVRALDNALQEALRLAEESKAKAGNMVEEAKWPRRDVSSPTHAVTGLDVEQLRHRLEELVGSLWSTVTTSLTRQTDLYSHLYHRAVALDICFQDVQHLDSAVPIFRQHTSSASAFQSEAAQVVYAPLALNMEISTSLLSDFSGEYKSAASQRYAALESAVSSLREDANRLAAPVQLASVDIIPLSFLGSVDIHPERNDFVATADHDNAVRAALAKSVKELEDALQKAGEQLRLAKHHEESSAWDQSFVVAQLSVDAAYSQITELSMIDHASLPQGDLEESLHRATVHASSLDGLPPCLSSLDKHLETLRSSPSSSSQPFHDHSVRLAKLRELRHQVDDTLVTSLKLLETLRCVSAERSAKYEAERLAREEEERCRLDNEARASSWRERCTSLSTRLQRTATEVRAVDGKAQTELYQLSEERSAQRAQRAAILSAEALDHEETLSELDSSHRLNLDVMVCDLERYAASLASLRSEFRALEDEKDRILVDLDISPASTALATLGDEVEGAKGSLETLRKALDQGDDEDAVWKLDHSRMLQDRNDAAQAEKQKAEEFGRLEREQEREHLAEVEARRSGDERQRLEDEEQIESSRDETAITTSKNSRSDDNLPSKDRSTSLGAGSSPPEGIVSDDVQIVESPSLDDLFAEGFRQPKSRPRVSITSRDNLEDIFGPTLHAHPFPNVEEETEDPAVTALRIELADIEVDKWLEDEPYLPLPEVDDVLQLRSQLTSATTHYKDLKPFHLEVLSMTADLEHKTLAVSRLEQLAAFRSKSDIADTQLSALLDAIDAATGMEVPEASRPTSPDVDRPVLSVGDALVAASQAVTAARMDAILLVDDQRVEARLRRLEQAFSEMTQMVEDLDHPRPPSSLSSGTASTSSRLPRPSHLSLPNSRPQSRTASVASSRASSRSASRSSNASIASSTMSKEARSPTVQPLPSYARPTSAASSRASRRAMDPPPPLPSPVSTPRQRRSGTSSRPSNIPTPRSQSVTASPVNLLSTPRPRIKSLAATLPKAFTFGTSNRPNSLSKSTSSALGSPSQSQSPAWRETISSASRRVSSKSTFSSASSTSAMRRMPSTVSRRDSVASTSSSSSLWSPRNVSGGSTSSPPRHLSSPLITPMGMRSYSTVGSSGYGRSPPSSGKRRGGTLAPKTVYKPNTKRKIDVEVGRIVNSFPVSVQIKAVDNHFADESGMYWIGERSYFIRILRSRSCMVRIGGGWQELSAFLQSHYANTEELAAVTISPSHSLNSSLNHSVSSLSKSVGPSGEPRWLSSNSLSASTSSLSVRSVSLGVSEGSGQSAPMNGRSVSGGLHSGFGIGDMRRSLSRPSLPVDLVESTKSNTALPRWRR